MTPSTISKNDLEPDVRQQFKCRVWAQVQRRFRLVLGRAPIKHWNFTQPKNASVVLNHQQVLTLKARSLREREIPLAEVSSLTRQPLPIGRQMLSVVVDTLLVGVGLGLLVSVVYLLQGDGLQKASLPGFLNLFVLFFGVGAGLCLLYALPTLLRLRALELFSLHFSNGRQWDLGVPAEHADPVAAMLASWGIPQQVQ